MKNILTIVLLFVTIVSTAQTKEQVKTEKWFLRKNINLMEALPPNGFEKFVDCESRPAYIKHSGDTVLLYSWNGSTAQTLKDFKKTLNHADYGRFTYSSKVQNNGTVIINKLKLRTFIWRNDTLYLYDDYNADLENAKMEVMFDYFDKKISKSTYETKLKEINAYQYPFNPTFKAIYFKDIFKNAETYTFDKNQNFREESVNLINQWTTGDTKFVEINLNTYTSGTYRFSTDLRHIETTNCNRKQ